MVCKVAIDFDVWIEGKSFGFVSGDLELEAAPTLGSTILFDRPYDGDARKRIKSTSWNREVKKIMFAPLESASTGAKVFLILEDADLKTEEEARALISYYEKSFNFIGTIFND